MKKIKSIFRSEKQFRLFLILLASTVFSVALFGTRLMFVDFDFGKIQSIDDLIYYRGNQTYFFLNWNLFLAWVPYLLVLTLPFLYKKTKSKILVVSILFLWLLFFPNAPYLLTDLLHLRKRSGVPLWFDMMLLLSFAWTGLILGYLSLLEVQRFLLNFFSKKTVEKISFGAILLCGFGIYLGRFQRWNSWDIVTQPVSLFSDILNLLAQPQTLGLAMVISVFLFLGYLTLSTLAQKEY